MKNKIKLTLASLSFLLPALSSAQYLGQTQNLALSAESIINILIRIAFILALLYFFWGVASYILDDKHDKEVAKKRMVWGVVALFVMATVWGLVVFIGGELGIGPVDAITIPKITP